jgi:hypothetical protein
MSLYEFWRSIPSLILSIRFGYFLIENPQVIFYAKISSREQKKVVIFNFPINMRRCILFGMILKNDKR